MLSSKLACVIFATVLVLILVEENEVNAAPVPCGDVDFPLFPRKPHRKKDREDSDDDDKSKEQDKKKKIEKIEELLKELIEMK